ncbi:MAG TPA: hypothetical protein VNF99_02295 [Stellaceae bacterium]|nr:hypothetical protein [Stellaceae bacterium]
MSREHTGNSEDDMEPAIEVSETQAKQGVTLGRMRYVLAISLALAVVAMVLVFIL